MHLSQLAHSPGPHGQSKPIKISSNESTKSSSSSTSTGSSADSTERLILSKQNTIVKSSIPQTGTLVTTTTTTTNTSNSSNVSTNADDTDFDYESIVDPNVTKPKYAYHDEPHSFENSMEFLEDYKNFQYEVLETTV